MGELKTQNVFFTFLLIVFVIRLCVSSETCDKDKHVFILAGQSNMAGRGGVIDMDTRWDGIVPREDKPHPGILRLSAQLLWQSARDPLHADIDTNKTCGVGPGMAFANAFIACVPGAVVGLVPCAIGGTAIREWEKGGELYEKMMVRAKESLREGGHIKALLWYQGESDTLSRDDADSYKDNMEKLIGDFRADLYSPTLPVIQGRKKRVLQPFKSYSTHNKKKKQCFFLRLGDAFGEILARSSYWVAIASGEGPFTDNVREAQLGINLPNVYCVDAKGLPLKDDHLHLTTESQVKLGKMLADEYFKHFTS